MIFHCTSIDVRKFINLGLFIVNPLLGLVFSTPVYNWLNLECTVRKRCACRSSTSWSKNTDGIAVVPTAGAAGWGGSGFPPPRPPIGGWFPLLLKRILSNNVSLALTYKIINKEILKVINGLINLL